MKHYTEICAHLIIIITIFSLLHCLRFVYNNKLFVHVTKYSYLIQIICIQLYGFKYVYPILRIVLSELKLGSYGLLWIQVRADRIVKRYFRLPRAPELDPHYWMQFIVITRTYTVLRGARGVMVIVVGNGHDHTSSNPGRGWLHFTLH